MRTTRKIAAAIAIAGTVAALAGCASGTSSSTPTTEPTGAPLTIGVIAPLAGATALPAAEYGVLAAQDYINHQLGGIGGRPLELDWCKSDGTPEFLVNCANHFVEAGVPLVYDASTLAIPAAAPILKQAGIPIVGSYPASTGVEAQDYGSSFYFAGGAAMHAVGLTQSLAAVDAKTAALAVTASPQAKAYVDGLVVPMSQAQGVTTTVTLVDPGPLNAQVVATTLLSGKPDVNLFTALRGQGFTGTILGGNCTSFLTTMGADAEGILLQARVWSPGTYDNAPSTVQDQLDAYKAAMANVGHTDDIDESHAVAGFGGLVTLATALEKATGDIDAKSVVSTLEGLKDFPAWLLPNVTCDGNQWPKNPGVCSHSELFLEVQADGSLKPLGGDWTEISAP
jgi:branched-chain amino acid transport system substrate-binding protein